MLVYAGQGHGAHYYVKWMSVYQALRKLWKLIEIENVETKVWMTTRMCTRLGNASDRGYNCRY